MQPDRTLFGRPRVHSVPFGFSRMSLLLSVLAGLVLPAALAALVPGCGRGKPHDQQEGDLPYAILDKALQPLRRDFEDADGKVRLVGIGAPTCGECVGHVATIDEQLLPAVPGEDFEVFIVWVSVAPPDIELRTRALAEKYADPRIRHYWDGSGRIARAFGRHVGFTDGSSVYGLFYLYGRGDTWDPQGKMASEPAGYNAVLNDWEPSPPRARAGQHPRLRLPQLVATTMRAQIEELLAEPDPAAGTGRR